MRARHVLILVLLAAVPIALAVALGGGGERKAKFVPAVQVSLHLAGGGGKAAISACGTTHHYKIYPGGSTIAFRGASSLSGGASLRVKLKLKVCVGGAFEPAGEAAATVAANGSFIGSFHAPSDGAYSARAELKQGGVLITRSRKRYFEVR